MPDPCLGVLGGGQLALMLAQAASNLAVRVRTFDTAPDAPAARFADHTVGRFDDREAIARFAAGCDAVTCEFENVPASTLEAAAGHAPVCPSPKAFATAQDRALERGLFESLGISTPRWMKVDRVEEIEEAIRAVGLPMILKTRRMGYDGKGQRVVRTRSEAELAARDLLGSPRGGLIADQMIDLRSEVSVIAARSRDGKIGVYPLCENEHRHGILWKTIAPAPIASGQPALSARAQDAAKRVLHALEYVGVMALEFFVAGTGDRLSSGGNAGELDLLVNEMAPRVHNTGHWTIEGAQTSQFENHVRAALGLPLGQTGMCISGAHAMMLNMVGRLPERSETLAVDGAHVHLYGKAARPGRKVGHVTMLDSDADALARRGASMEQMLAWSVDAR